MSEARPPHSNAAQRASALVLLVGKKAVAQLWAEAPAALSRMMCPSASLTEAAQVLQDMAKAARMAAEEAQCLILDAVVEVVEISVGDRA